MPEGQLVYARRNGRVVLQVTGHPRYGVPFGQDRIVPIFLATLAVQQKSQTIRFRTAAAMLETFGMHKGGKEYRRLIGAFERIFGATIFFGTDTVPGTAKLIHRSRFNFLREAQIWYNRRTDQPVLSEEFENVIVLSDEFFLEITAHPILRTWKRCACWPLLRPYSICSCGSPIDAFWPKERKRYRSLVDMVWPPQLGNVEYTRPRKFREKLDQWLRAIHAMWPECPARIHSDGMRLLIKGAVAFRPQCPQT